MYYLHDGKEQAGPFSFEDLEKIENKNHYYVWFEGLNDWQLLGSLFEKKREGNCQENDVKAENRTTENKSELDEGRTLLKIFETKSVNNGLSNMDKECVVETVNKKPKKSNEVIPIIIITAFFGFAIFFFIKFLQSKSTINNMTFQYNKLTDENADLQTAIITSSNIYHVIVDSIYFKNGNDNNYKFSSVFLSSETKYIYPIISVKKIWGRDDERINLQIKIINADGTVFRNQKISPIGYSYDSELEVASLPTPSVSGDSDVVLTGWGSSTSPSYNPGYYKVQIWYKNKCLIEGGFKVI
jgi:hypothetical protein